MERCTIDKSDTIGKLAEALAKAQGQFGALIRSRTVDYVTRTGPRIKYSYAELSDVLDVIRKPLSENGLAILQPAGIAEGQVTVRTLLVHASGEWIASDLALTCLGKSPQEEGSALTYARRYGLSALIGIASEDDDDGATAQHGTEQSDQAETGTPPPDHQAQTVNPVPRPTEHWCAEHKTQFFQKGKMKSFAHPIKDAQGTATGSWCQEHTNAPAPRSEPQGTAVQPPDEDLFPKPAVPAPAAGPTTIPDLLKRCYDEYGLKPHDVALEAAVESTARIPDVARVWAMITAKYPRK